MQNKTCRKYVTHLNTISKTGKGKGQTTFISGKERKKKKDFQKKVKKRYFLFEGWGEETA